MFYKRIAGALDGADVSGRRLTVYVPRGAVSKAVGQHGANRERLTAEFSPKKLVFREDGELSGCSVRAEID